MCCIQTWVNCNCNCNSVVVKYSWGSSCNCMFLNAITCNCNFHLCNCNNNWVSVTDISNYKFWFDRHHGRCFIISFLRTYRLPAQLGNRDQVPAVSLQPLPSARQHPSYGDCLEVKREYYQNSSVLDCVTQCSQSSAHLIWVVLTGPTDWVCHIGTLTLCVDAVA